MAKKTKEPEPSPDPQVNAPAVTVDRLEELFADGTLQVLPVTQPVSRITAPVAKQSVQFEGKLKLRKSSNHKSAAAPASNACEKHPSSGVTKKGVCKGCTKAAYTTEVERLRDSLCDLKRGGHMAMVNIESLIALLDDMKPIVKFWPVKE